MVVVCKSTEFYLRDSFLGSDLLKTILLRSSFITGAGGLKTVFPKLILIALDSARERCWCDS